MMRSRFAPCVAFLLGSLSLQVHAAPANDPWEGFNRQVFRFNEFLDRNVLKPVARGYQTVTPDFVDTGVSNVFGNLGEVPSFANHVLQGKWGDAGANGERLLINSTLGLLGLFDVASKLGIDRHDTDAGITLGRWGVGSGPYLMLPLLGPSSLRDGVGRSADVFMHPLYYVDEERLRYSLRALEIVDSRADVLEVEELITGDRYVFLRNLYLQRRLFLLGGESSFEDEFDDDFGDEFDAEPAQP